MNAVYSDSRDNARAIESFGHDIRYDTDATKLPETFETKFDRVQFNFPHWRGKANIRYNRLLMKDFFRSASQVIDPSNGGSIDVALMKPQGGIAAKTMTEWKQSWMPAVYAAYADLLLVSARPFLVGAAILLQGGTIDFVSRASDLLIAILCS